MNDKPPDCQVQGPQTRSQRWAVAIIVLAGALTVAALATGNDSHRFGWSDWLGTPGQPIAISHQGAPTDLSRPDLAGFVTAVETYNYQYMETDVRLINETSTAGNQGEGRLLVALHQVSADLPSLDDLAETGFTPPTVIELLTDSRLAGVRWNFELKGGGVPAATELKAILDATGAHDRVCVSFGDIKWQPTVARVRQILDLHDGCSCASFPEKSFFFDFDLARLITEPFRDSTGDLVSCVQILHQLITEEDVAEAHRHGIAIHAWELNLDLPAAVLGQDLPDEISHLSDIAQMDQDRMIELLDMGVDGITTDDPALLRYVLACRGEWHTVITPEIPADRNWAACPETG